MKKIEVNKVYNMPCEEGLALLEDNSIDFVCIDPPYTDGKGTDVLSGHEIQTKIDILAVTKEHYRVLKPNCFYAVFGQMPTILAWFNAAVESGFKFKQDITWCKRDAPLSVRLNRVHELIYIFVKGSSDFHNYKAPYADLKIPDTLFGLYNIESVFRELSYWKSKAKGINVTDGSNRNIKKKRNDKYYNYMDNMSDGGSLGKSDGDIKLNTIWSFLPENKINRGSNNSKHPTVKPIKLIERLIKLCTPESPEIVVLDSFTGSGTTFLAAKNTARKFIGFEIAKKYCDMSNSRAENNINLFPNF